MRQGDLFHHVMAGGGGYRDALERDPALVLDDVIEGKVTRLHAAAAYGVVITDAPVPCVHATATAPLRARLRRTRRSTVTRPMVVKMLCGTRRRGSVHDRTMRLE